MSIYSGSSELSKIYVGSNEVAAVYVGDKQVRPYHFNPTSSTVMYYPFETDQLDKVGSSSIGTTGTQQTIGYTFSANTTMNITSYPTTCRFISVWIKYNSSNGKYVQGPKTFIGGCLYNFSHSLSYLNKAFQYHSSSTGTTEQQYPHSSTINTTTGTWYHMAYGTDGSKAYAYLNGSKVWEVSITPGLATETNMYIGNMINETLSDLIGENRVWTATEITNYYNNTKSNYGL